MLTGVQARARRAYRYLFGPVPSRRLGRSLGVDPIPFKTCTSDCVFCQMGRTTRRTIERRAYVPPASIEAELEAWTREGVKADYVTLSGSGEPTLHGEFGGILQAMRRRTGLPTALLSNGTLFGLSEVREAAKQADVVKLSLSAWDPVSFDRIQRPHPEVRFERILDGYRAFRDGFRGRLWIEVFLVPGMNSAPGEVGRIASLVASIGPDETHLNTAVRPPAEPFVRAVPRTEMEALARLFRPAASVTAEFPSDLSAEVAADERAILAMLQRRPCTAAQIADVFGMHPNEVSKYVGRLSRTGRIRATGSGRDAYFEAIRAEGDEGERSTER